MKPGCCHCLKHALIPPLLSRIFYIKPIRKHRGCDSHNRMSLRYYTPISRQVRDCTLRRACECNSASENPHDDAVLLADAVEAEPRVVKSVTGELARASALPAEIKILGRLDFVVAHVSIHRCPPPWRTRRSICMDTQRSTRCILTWREMRKRPVTVPWEPLRISRRFRLI